MEHLADIMDLAAVDAFAAKEGVNAALDPEINNVVNDEINKL